MITKISRYIFTGIIIALFVHPSWAQTQSVLDKIHKTFRANDQLESILGRVSVQKKDYINTIKGLDKETAKILRSLKNPFAPKLPQPVEEPAKSPRKVPKPHVVKKPEPMPVKKGPRPITQKPEISKPNFFISGMVWDTEYPQAIINTQILNVGDRIENWTISHIGPNGVEITYKNTRFVIKP
ncbi:MAG: hypothetical protein KAJ18_03785 [Candidatus Omnitrophica bacterium]|nr:hypothetical protein [Candidatus Omnitrophota bacterium]